MVHVQPAGQPFLEVQGRLAQAHFVIARSRTKRADVELVFVAQVFTEFRNGNPVAKDDDKGLR